MSAPLKPLKTMQNLQAKAILFANEKGPALCVESANQSDLSVPDSFASDLRADPTRHLTTGGS